MKSNILPDLTTWEYAALKSSIRRWKVIVPVVTDEHGNIIDGHQRVRACEELSIADYPVLTQAGLTEDEKLDHAYILNLVRRRLNRQHGRSGCRSLRGRVHDGSRMPKPRAKNASSGGRIGSLGSRRGWQVDNAVTDFLTGLANNALRPTLALTLFNPY